MDGTVLVADDDRTIRTVLTQALTRAGCRVHATGSMKTLMLWVKEGRGDAVISDVVMPDGNGLKSLPHIRELRPDLPVIIISAQNTIMTAIQATESDAFDYLPKPFDLPDLMKRTAKALERKRIRTPNKPSSASEETVPDPQQNLPLVGATSAMQDLYRMVARIINIDLPVLIMGESGTGKSLITSALHDYSERKNAPFVVVTSEEAASAQALQHLMTQAIGGTLLFDGIDDFDSDTQARLSKLLDKQKGKGMARIFATTQNDIAHCVAKGSFRDDLFYKLAGVELRVPALRDRLDDIPLLAEHFLSISPVSPPANSTASTQSNDYKRRFSAEAMDHLKSYSWPGNLRQLENLMYRLMVTTNEEKITKIDVETALGTNEVRPMQGAKFTEERLSDAIFRHVQRYFDLHGDSLPPSGLYQRILYEVERPLIEIALEATAGNQAKCADLLGINRNTLRKKINELEIEVTRRRKLM